MKKTIVLIHGLHMYSWSLFYLAAGFRKAGCDVKVFGYHTVKFNREKTLSDLHEFLNSLKTHDITLIGHSMGGMVAKLYFQTYQAKNIGRIITIGTPHNGSFMARYLLKTPVKFLLGTSAECGFITPPQKWNNIIPLGCIAGNANFGMTSMLAKLHGNMAPSDGTVFLNEAIDENAHDYTVLPLQHTQMIMKKEVIDDCMHFIKTHKFLTSKQR